MRSGNLVDSGLLPLRGWSRPDRLKKEANSRSADIAVGPVAPTFLSDCIAGLQTCSAVRTTPPCNPTAEQTKSPRFSSHMATRNTTRLRGILDQSEAPKARPHSSLGHRPRLTFDSVVRAESPASTLKCPSLDAWREIGRINFLMNDSPFPQICEGMRFAGAVPRHSGINCRKDGDGYTIRPVGHC